MYDRIRQFRSEFAIMLANGTNKNDIVACLVEMFDDSCSGFEDQVIIENLREVYQRYRVAAA